ncbi:MAG: aminotransferase class V-fold PLP-dependent enzyme [Candidatus Krumholzibacteriota bacterium]|nr:aminotransferase class V-fold PLP-dependent enzyme [Candidatus Krumholzibacteriota bacterium]
MIDIARVREEFPLAREWCFLATASDGILPERSRRWLADYFAGAGYLEVSPVYARYFEELAALRERAGRVLGGRARNWSLQPNTSYGLNTVAAAVPWREGDNVVLADREFPANVQPWMNLALRGVAARRVPAPDHRARAEDLLAACDARTRVVAVSGVGFLSGYATDLAALSIGCRERGIWLCVDGIQGLGNRAWDLAALGVDFLAAGGQKWLCAPRGAGLLWVSDRALAALDVGTLRPGLRGWLDMRRWNVEDLLDYDQPVSRGARRLEIGTYAWHDFVCLGHSLALLEELGLAEVAAHADRLRERFLDGLAAHGLAAPAGPYEALAAADPPERRSQVVGLRCTDASGLRARLMARRVVASAREDLLRVAFHHYNDESDVDRLLEGLAAG